MCARNTLNGPPLPDKTPLGSRSMAETFAGRNKTVPSPTLTIVVFFGPSWHSNPQVFAEMNSKIDAVGKARNCGSEHVRRDPTSIVTCSNSNSEHIVGSGLCLSSFVNTHTSYSWQKHDLYSSVRTAQLPVSDKAIGTGVTISGLPDLHKTMILKNSRQQFSISVWHQYDKELVHNNPFKMQIANRWSKTIQYMGKNTYNAACDRGCPHL